MSVRQKKLKDDEEKALQAKLRYSRKNTGQ